MRSAVKNCPREFKSYWATSLAAAAPRRVDRARLVGSCGRMASTICNGHNYPPGANAPISATNHPGQRALWRRFALEWPFGARRASCGSFGV